MIEKKALVLGGKTGFLGQALAQVLTAQGWEIICPGRNDLDVFNQNDMDRYLETHRPSHIFNTIGYTQVDTAEEDQNQAALLNKTLPVLLARLARQRGLYFIHYSTDFVFDGKKTTPYLIEDSTSPLNIYGQSKRDGEQGILALGWEKTLIIRTAWLFGPFKTNFVDRIIELAQERDSLGIVHDQIGSPTFTMDLACHTLELIKRNAKGIYHITNSGHASWCELAAEAIACAGVPCHVKAIASKDYPQKAVRPAYSVLDCSAFIQKTGITPRPWVQALRAYLFNQDHPCHKNQQ
ncbi:MAG: dTDP-4-dehydrorhamnose reductase [Desulfoplanes sp.]|nr:dTDP-4-dehydrorhamnose reductase [Desulfoplanes sp.]